MKILSKQDLEHKKKYLVWFPQIPCDGFYIEVKDFEDASRIHNILANYDYFQMKKNIKPDYSNACDMIEFDEEDQEWLTFYDENGLSLDEYLKEK